MDTITINELLKKFSKAELLTNNKVEIVDVRSPDEFKHEHIEGAKNIPIDQVSTRCASGCEDHIAIFHCQSGNRTELNRACLEGTAFKEKYCLAGGLTAWKNAKLPVVKMTTAPIDVMRQVQLIVSVMILGGVALSYFFSPYFIIITIFAGLGLLVAGLTGFCGMASLLKYMPWNKQD